MSQRPSRIVLMSRRQAWPWRWDLALLELGCRHHWRLPTAAELKAHATWIGRQLQTGDGAAALCFEGYTLVGACWHDGIVGDFGPHVMPGPSGHGLEVRLLAAIGGSGRLPVDEVDCPTDMARCLPGQEEVVGSQRQSHGRRPR